MSKKYNEIEVKNNMEVNKEEDVQVEVDTVREKKDIKQITSVIPAKKKNLFSRATVALLGEEGIRGLGHYVAEEIILPAAKNLIVDSVTTGINRLIYGEKGGPVGGGYRPSGYSSHYQPRTNYTSRYTSQQPQPRTTDEPRTRPGRRGVDEYLIENRNDATSVLANLAEYADNYDTVSVADYYDLIGVPSQYTDNNYGWTIDTIGRATIVPVRGGYTIKFPPVEVI